MHAVGTDGLPLVLVAVVFSTVITRRVCDAEAGMAWHGRPRDACSLSRQHVPRAQQLTDRRGIVGTRQRALAAFILAGARLVLVLRPPTEAAASATACDGK
jgi:hypothetical protein